MNAIHHFMSTDATLCAAAAQFSATTDVDHNLRKIEDLSTLATKRGARVVVFPEASMHAWNASGQALVTAADMHYTRFMDNLSDIARDAGITLIVGVFAPAPDGSQPRNRMVVHGPDGELRGRYDKVHLYDAFSYRESDKVSPGPTQEDLSELCTVSVGPFTLGLLNCYDLRFPEMARALVDRGADVLVVSSAWVAGPNKEMHWETLLRARAIENTCYVLASGQSPPESCGMSMIIDPSGLVAATCAEREGLAVHELDTTHLRSVREIAPTLQHRRYAVVASSDAAKPASGVPGAYSASS